MDDSHVLLCYNTEETLLFTETRHTFLELINTQRNDCIQYMQATY